MKKKETKHLGRHAPTARTWPGNARSNAAERATNGAEAKETTTENPVNKTR